LEKFDSVLKRFNLKDLTQTTFRSALKKDDFDTDFLSYYEIVELYFKLNTDMNQDDLKMMSDVLSTKYKSGSVKDKPFFISVCNHNIQKNLHKNIKDITRCTVFKKKVSYHIDSKPVMEVFPKFSEYGNLIYSKSVKSSNTARFSLVDCDLYFMEAVPNNLDPVFDKYKMQIKKKKLAWYLNIKEISIEDLRKFLIRTR
jgi:hypothetical protein